LIVSINVMYRGYVFLSQHFLWYTLVSD